MKRLFELTRTWYVMAESIEDVEGMYISAPCEPTEEVFEATFVEESWWDAIPYNGDDDRTCGQILTEQRAMSLKNK